MQILPFKVKILQPPQADLYIVLAEIVADIKPGDILVITSKVISIHQGQCIKIDNQKYEEQKNKLIQTEADVIVSHEVTKNLKQTHLTKKNNIWIGSAGIDESNGNGYFILWPKNSQNEAKLIYQWFSQRLGYSNFGIIITDTYKRPFRNGAIGFALAHYGFKAIKSYSGKQDLFGRIFKNERINQADALAAGAGLVMGEGNEQTPLAIIRDAKDLEFYDGYDELAPSEGKDYFEGLINTNYQN